MGACFQAPHCHTQTMTDGNAPCSLLSFIFQHVTLTRSYKVRYRQYESLQYILDKNKLYAQSLLQKNPQYIWYYSLRESLSRYTVI